MKRHAHAKTANTAVTIAETPRLQLREFDASDAPALSAILANPRVMEYSRNGPFTEAETRAFVEGCNQSYRDRGYGQWAVVDKVSEAVIGFCGLSRTVVDGAEVVELAYRLAHDRWGQGLATEAARRAAGYGFEVCKLDEMVGIVAPRHAASIRVLEKVGFTPSSETWYCGWDVLIYRLTERGWRTRGGVIHGTHKGERICQRLHGSTE